MESVNMKGDVILADHMNQRWESMRGLLHSKTGSWQKCWEEDSTPWDLGHVTPIIQHLVQTDALPKGRVLVPGCGRLAASSANANCITFIADNFFTWQPNAPFDLIYDYTFFCAIEPKMRPAWASRMAELLKPDGELLTLMFPISDHTCGPPYKVSVSDYEEVLAPLGFKAVSITDNEHAVDFRKGYEKIGRWKRTPN